MNFCVLHQLSSVETTKYWLHLHDLLGSEYKYMMLPTDVPVVSGHSCSAALDFSQALNPGAQSVLITAGGPSNGQSSIPNWMSAPLRVSCL